MSSGKKTIAIVGGGVAATTVAAALETAIKKAPGYEIVLITGKDYFFHLIAGLRANVSSADIAEQIAVPYDRFFKDSSLSRIITKKATEVQANQVVLEDGTIVPFEYCIVATGKQWTAPVDVPQSRTEAISRMKAYRNRVADAQNILIVGGGAVGLEMAGELAEAYPPASGKTITVIHNQPKVLNDAFTDRLRLPLQQQAEAMGIKFLLGDALDESQLAFMNDENAGTAPRTLTTRNGKTLENVDLVIVSLGGKVNTEVLRGLLPADQISRGGVKVEPTFQLAGHKNIFALGDLADLPEQKAAMKAVNHAPIVVKNVIASIQGNALTTYKSGPEMIVVTLGSKGGQGQIAMPIIGTFYPGAWFARMVKSKELFVAKSRAALGY